MNLSNNIGFPACAKNFVDNDIIALIHPQILTFLTLKKPTFRIILMTIFTSLMTANWCWRNCKTCRRGERAPPPPRVLRRSRFHRHAFRCRRRSHRRCSTCRQCQQQCSNEQVGRSREYPFNSQQHTCSNEHCFVNDDDDAEKLFHMIDIVLKWWQRVFGIA